MNARILTWLNKSARLAVVRVTWPRFYGQLNARLYADFIAGPDGARSLLACDEWAPEHAASVAADCARMTDAD